MTARITTASLSARIDSQEATLGQILAAVQGKAVFSTPAAVLDAPAPVVPVVVSASDALRTFVEAKGLHFARGGRVHLTTEALAAAVRVLKTGTPECLSVEGVGSLDKRNVTHLAIGRADDGRSVITQYVYTASAE